MLCPNDAIALFAPALPDRMFVKPGAPAGMLKFQFDPLPTHCQGQYLRQPSGRVYQACRSSACLHPSENFVLGNSAVLEGQRNFEMEQGQHLVA